APDPALADPTLALRRPKRRDGLAGEVHDGVDTVEGRGVDRAARRIPRNLVRTARHAAYEPTHPVTRRPEHGQQPCTDQTCRAGDDDDLSIAQRRGSRVRRGGHACNLGGTARETNRTLPFGNVPSVE